MSVETEFMSCDASNVMGLAERLAHDADHRKAMTGRLMVRVMPHMLEFFAAEFGARDDTSRATKVHFSEAMVSALANLTALCVHLTLKAAPCDCCRANYTLNVCAAVDANLVTMASIIAINEALKPAQSDPDFIAATHEAPGIKQ